MAGKGTAARPCEDEQEDCGICFEPVLGKRGKLDSCNHWFCSGCIEPWTKTSSICPTCKQRFKSVTQVDLDTGRAARPKKIPKRDFEVSEDEEDLIAMQHDDSDSEYEELMAPYMPDSDGEDGEDLELIVAEQRRLLVNQFMAAVNKDPEGKDLGWLCLCIQTSPDRWAHKMELARSLVVSGAAMASQERKEFYKSALMEAGVRLSQENLHLCVGGGYDSENSDDLHDWVVPENPSEDEVSMGAVSELSDPADSDTTDTEDSESQPEPETDNTDDSEGEGRKRRAASPRRAVSGRGRAGGSGRAGRGGRGRASAREQSGRGPRPAPPLAAAAAAVAAASAAAPAAAAAAAPAPAPAPAGGEAVEAPQAPRRGRRRQRDSGEEGEREAEEPPRSRQRRQAPRRGPAAAPAAPVEEPEPESPQIGDVGVEPSPLQKFEAEIRKEWNRPLTMANEYSTLQPKDFLSAEKGKIVEKVRLEPAFAYEMRKSERERRKALAESAHLDEDDDVKNARRPTLLSDRHGKKVLATGQRQRVSRGGRRLSGGSSQGSAAAASPTSSSSPGSVSGDRSPSSKISDALARWKADNERSSRMGAVSNVLTASSEPVSRVKREMERLRGPDRRETELEMAADYASRRTEQLSEIRHKEEQRRKEEAAKRQRESERKKRGAIPGQVVFGQSTSSTKSSSKRAERPSKECDKDLEAELMRECFDFAPEHRNPTIASPVFSGPPPAGQANHPRSASFLNDRQASPRERSSPQLTRRDQAKKLLGIPIRTREERKEAKAMEKAEARRRQLRRQERELKEKAAIKLAVKLEKQDKLVKEPKDEKVFPLLVEVPKAPLPTTEKELSVEEFLSMSEN